MATLDMLVQWDEIMIMLCLVVKLNNVIDMLYLLCSWNNLKVSHPRCVVKNKYVKKILFLQSQNTTKHKTKFITILQQHVSA